MFDFEFKPPVKPPKPISVYRPRQPDYPLPNPYRHISMYRWRYAVIDYDQFKEWRRDELVRWRFEQHVYPARPKFTYMLKRLAAAGCPVLAMYYIPHGRSRYVRAYGPVEVLSEELRNYPMYMTASIKFFEPIISAKSEYLPNFEQFRVLHRFTS